MPQGQKSLSVAVWGSALRIGGLQGDFNRRSMPEQKSGSRFYRLPFD